MRRVGTGGPYGELAVADLGGRQSHPATVNQLHQLTDDAAFVGSPAWSPDGGFIYFASGRGGAINIWKIGRHGGPLEQITMGQGDDADLDVSADGRRIVFSGYRTNINLEQIDLNNSGPPGHRWLTSDSARGELAPAYSRDGKRIAYFANRRGAEREGVWVMEADGRNPVLLVEDERINNYPRWSADDRSIIHASRMVSKGGGLSATYELRRVTLAGGASVAVPLSVADATGDVGPQDLLLYRGGNGAAQVFDPKTNQVQRLTDVQGTYLRWCPDGRRFAAMVHPRNENDAAAGIWIYDLSGKRQQAFRGWAAFYSWAGPDNLLVLELHEADLSMIENIP